MSNPGPPRASAAVDESHGARLVAPFFSDVSSGLYDGGGTGRALQVIPTAASVVACGAAVLNAKGMNILDLFLVNSTGSQGCTVKVSEFSAATPTVATQIRQIEQEVSSSDHGGTADRAAWGLSTATEYAPKEPIRIPITPGAYVMVTLSASDGGTWYARYQLRASMISDMDLLLNMEASMDEVEAKLDSLRDSLNPTTAAALTSKTTTSSTWDEDTSEVELSAIGGLLFAHVHVTQDCYLLADQTAADPSVDPAVYSGGVTHRIDCRGATHLHYKRAGANNVTLTGAGFS